MTNSRENKYCNEYYRVKNVNEELEVTSKLIQQLIKEEKSTIIIHDTNRDIYKKSSELLANSGYEVIEILVDNLIVKNLNIPCLDLKFNGFSNKCMKLVVIFISSTPSESVIDSHFEKKVISTFVSKLYKKMAQAQVNYKIQSQDNYKKLEEDEYDFQVKLNKTIRTVQIILPDFENIGQIEAFDKILVLCLGRKIQFNLLSKSFGELSERYIKDVKEQCKLIC